MCAGRPPSKREELNEAALLEGHFLRRPPLDCPILAFSFEGCLLVRRPADQLVLSCDQALAQLTCS